MNPISQSSVLSSASREAYNKLHKPINPYSTDEDIFTVIDEEKNQKKSRIIEWYNTNIDPYHNGLNVMKEMASLGPIIDKLFQPTALPVKLESLYIYLNPTDFHQFLVSNLLERIIITILNEEDNRISNLETKYSVLDIFHTLLTFQRIAKIRLRMAFQNVNERWIDEVYEAETEEMKQGYLQLFIDIKALMIACWRITDDMTAVLLEEKANEYSIEQTKNIILQHYAAIQFQSIIRGYLDRRHLVKALQAEKEEQTNEIKKWSIVIIQKVVRGFIARRTIIRSMKIRKTLPKELLQIAEKYLIVPKDPKNDDRRVGEEEYDRIQRKTKEKFQSPDLWGFLSEINQELTHFKREIYENEKREDAYATKFVEKVVAHREKEFEGIWEKFPKALQNFTKDTNNTHLIGSLLPMKKDELVTLHYGELQAKEDAKHPKTTIHKIAQMFETKQLQQQQQLLQNQTSAMPAEVGEPLQILDASFSAEPSFLEAYPSISSTIESNAIQPLASPSYEVESSSSPQKITHQSTVSTLHSHSPSKSTVITGHSSVKKTIPNKQSQKTKKEITVDDVALAMTKNSQESFTILSNSTTNNAAVSKKSLIPSELISGPLVRKALQVTVQQEVSQQLNQLMNHNFHSRKLTNDILSAYGPDSVYVKGEATQKLLSGGFKKKGATNSKTAGSGGGVNNNKNPAKLQPIDVEEIKKQQQANKKKSGQKGFDGKVKEFKGKMESAHSDWIHDSMKNQKLKDPSSPRHITEEIVEGASRPQTTVPSGHSLLIDIPNGLQDSIERLVHAAALRCYVPDFFKGPRTESLSSEKDGTSDNDSQGSSVIITEQDDDSAVLAKRNKRNRRNKQNNHKEDPNYAYQLYLQMPMGLAKVKYEIDCHKWSQGVINKLRVKGLNYLPEVAPVSKFVICLRNVDAPKILIDKCVDLYLELKKMGDLPKGGKLPQSAVEKSVMEVGLSSSSPTKRASMAQIPMEFSSSSKKEDEEERRERRQIMQMSSPHERRSSNAEIQLKTDPLRTAENSAPDTVDTLNDSEGKELERKSSSSKRIMFDESLNTFSADETTGHELDEEEHNTSSSIEMPSMNKLPYGLSKHDLQLLEKASSLLQEILESTDTAEWCNLQGNIEELFIQAAFLIIPHTSTRFPYYNDLLRFHLEHSPDEETQLKTFYVNDEEEEEEEGGEKHADERAKGENDQNEEEIMGNYAFKLYMMELLQLTTEEEKTELIKTRFRASVIFTSPFTLYLKSKGITSIKQLLTIDLRDLQLPKPLFIQLEILINIIISAKIVKATLLAVPRDLQSLEKSAYYTPMFYDQKFQRNPLDPYGRPIGLGITQVKERLKQQDRMKEKKRKQRKDESNPLIEEDLNKEISIWEKNELIQEEEEEEEGEEGGEVEEEKQQRKDSTGQNTAQPQQSTNLHRTNERKKKESKKKSITPKNKNKNNLDLLLNEENHQFDFMMNQMDDQQLAEVKHLFPEVTMMHHGGAGGVKSRSANTTSPPAVRGSTSRESVSQEAPLTTPPIVIPKTTATVTGKASFPVEGQIASSSKRSRNHNHNNNQQQGTSSFRKSKQSESSTAPPITPSPQLRYDQQHFKQTRDFTLSTHPLIDPMINNTIFNNTYICHHVNCGQIFSRLYSYKVHLRTHDTFPEYFLYKRQPQLAYDQLPPSMD